MTPSYAPWTQEEVESLNGYQACGFFHEFTGDNGEILIATSSGWVTQEGGPVVQEWAYTFMTDGSWKQHAASMRSKGFRDR